MRRCGFFIALLLAFICFAPISSQAEEKLGANLEQMLREMLGGQPAQQRPQSPPPQQLGTVKARAFRARGDAIVFRALGQIRRARCGQCLYGARRQTPVAIL